MAERLIPAWLVATAAAGLLASCAAVAPELPPAAPEAPAPSWEDYGPRAGGQSRSWGRQAGRAPWPASARIERTALPPPAGPSEPAPAVPSAAGAAGRTASADVRNKVPSAAPVTSLWADGFVFEGFREDFDEAVRRAASRGMAEAEDAEGRVYSFTRKAGGGACATVEVTVLSAGRTLPVLSRGSAEACRR